MLAYNHEKFKNVHKNRAKKRKEENHVGSTFAVAPDHSSSPYRWGAGRPLRQKEGDHHAAPEEEQPAQQEAPPEEARDLDSRAQNTRAAAHATALFVAELICSGIPSKFSIFLYLRMLQKLAIANFCNI
ncbi:MAG: hypothetical protein KBC26_00900 [Candidatus Pacebacteria bacterium]|nr:hypothetical protein [Candidatus Paceibacterota bacterium]